MSNKKDVAIIPKGNYVSIMGCRITLLEDTKIEGNQVDIDYILKEQKDFNNGIGTTFEPRVQDEGITIHSPTKSVKAKRSGGKLGGKNNNWMS